MSHTNATYPYLVREAEESIREGRLAEERVHMQPHERPVEAARLNEIAGAALTQWLEIRLRAAFYAGRESIEREGPESWESRKIHLRRLYVSVSRQIAKEFSAAEDRPSISNPTE